MNSATRAAAAVLSLGVLLAACSGEMNPDYIGNLDDDLTFYADTAVMVNPGSAEIRRGEQVTTIVTARHKGTVGQHPLGLSAVDPRIPGVRVDVVPLYGNPLTETGAAWATSCRPARTRRSTTATTGG